MVLFWLLLLYLGCAIRGVFSLHISFICWFESVTVSFCFAGVSSVSARNAGEPGYCGLRVSRAEEVDGLELRALEITITVIVETILEDFWI